MEYKLSPLFTVYVIVLLDSPWLLLGTFNTWPTDKISLVKLFILFNSDTVVPNLFAIPYSVSPDTIFM